MSEYIDVTSREFPGFFLIAAITQAKAVGDKINSNPVSVTLLVNGVELPFTETMNDIYRRMEEQIDKQARELAERMVTAAGLEPLAEAIQKAEWEIKEAIAKVNL